MAGDAISEWPQVKLGTLVRPVSRPQAVQAGREYSLLGVRWYCDGARLHSKLAGETLQTPSLNEVRVGDITYNKMWVTKGAFAVLDARFDGLWATNEYPTFRADPTLLDTGYLWVVMQTDAFQAEAAGLCKGSTSRARLNPEDFLRIVIRRPPLPEQRKIAAILSSVDEAIRATQAVIDQTRRVKEGLLQDLLTCGIRHTRFKQTEIGVLPEQWDAVLLDSVAERGSGHTPDKKRAEYWGGDIKWVSLTDTHRLNRVYLSETTSTITEAGIANSSAVLHPVGTVFVSRDASVGRSAIATVPVAVSQHFIAWRCGPKLNNLFLYYLLQQHQPRFEQIAAGSTIKTIGLGYFRKLRIPLPDRCEQEAIGERLLAHDHAIWQNEARLREFARVKSGLLQDLLTGKVRVSA